MCLSRKPSLCEQRDMDLANVVKLYALLIVTSLNLPSFSGMPECLSSQVCVYRAWGIADKFSSSFAQDIPDNKRAAVVTTVQEATGEAGENPVSE